LQVLTLYGEGPHVTAIAFIPIVILALESAFLKRTRRSLALAALSMALVFVTNVPGTMALGLAVFCWICIHEEDLLAACKIAGVAAALGYAVACFAGRRRASPRCSATPGLCTRDSPVTLHHTPYLLPLLLAAIGGGAHLLGRLKAPRLVSFGAAYFVLTTALVWTA
jgi:hypothetical protein